MASVRPTAPSIQSPFHMLTGEASFDGIADAIHSSDLVLNIGPLLSDSNTGGFTRDITDANLVSLGHDFVQVRDKKFDGVHFLPVLKQIVEELKKEPSKYNLPRPSVSKKLEVCILECLEKEIYSPF